MKKCSFAAQLHSTVMKMKTPNMGRKTSFSHVWIHTQKSISFVYFKKICLQPMVVVSEGEMKRGVEKCWYAIII